MRTGAYLLQLLRVFLRQHASSLRLAGPHLGLLGMAEDSRSGS